MVVSAADLDGWILNLPYKSAGKLQIVELDDDEVRREEHMKVKKGSAGEHRLC